MKIKRYFVENGKFYKICKLLCWLVFIDNLFEIKGIK